MVVALRAMILVMILVAILVIIRVVYAWLSALTQEGIQSSVDSDCKSG